MSAYSVYMVGRRIFFYVLLVVLLLICPIGCGPQARLPSIEQLAEFENAGSILPSVDLDRLMRAKIGGGLYRVVPGDVLELTIPAILQVVTVERPESADGVTPYECRVSESGFITLPIAGEIEVGGKTLAEIELAVIDAYYPEYTATHLSVVAKVAEYRKATVSITGAVTNPGVYELQSDQMSLVTLLMQAGGIVDEGASFIHINHSDETIDSIDKMTTKKIPVQIFEGIRRVGYAHQNFNGMPSTLYPSDIEPAIYSVDYTASNEDALYEQLAKTYEQLVETLGVENAPGIKKEVPMSHQDEPITLPVRGLNIPFADVALQDGDTVVVEPRQQQLFTVIGLVKEPGNFPYPSDAKYNLMQALAFAGGLDKIAEPRYATIYRLKSDGTIVDTTFKLVDDSKLTNVINTTIKPGDIIDVAHTQRTRTNVFLERIFHVTFGAYVPVFR